MRRPDGSFEDDLDYFINWEVFLKGGFRSNAVGWLYSHELAQLIQNGTTTPEGAENEK